MIKSRSEIIRLIAECKVKPYGVSVGGIENEDLAELLEELLLTRDALENIKEIVGIT